MSSIQILTVEDDQEIGLLIQRTFKKVIVQKSQITAQTRGNEFVKNNITW